MAKQRFKITHGRTGKIDIFEGEYLDAWKYATSKSWQFTLESYYGREKTTVTKSDIEKEEKDG